MLSEYYWKPPDPVVSPVLALRTEGEEGSYLRRESCGAFNCQAELSSIYRCLLIDLMIYLSVWRDRSNYPNRSAFLPWLRFETQQHRLSPWVGFRLCSTQFWVSEHHNRDIPAADRLDMWWRAQSGQFISCLSPASGCPHENKDIEFYPYLSISLCFVLPSWYFYPCPSLYLPWLNTAFLSPPSLCSLLFCGPQEVPWTCHVLLPGRW